MVALFADKAAVLIEYPCHAAGHTRAEVLSGAAQHQHGAAGHVFATVIAHAFDDRGCTGVADSEAFAGAPGCEEPARGCAIERDIAQQDMMRAFTRGVALGAKHDLTAAEALANKVVGKTLEHQPHSGYCECTERLSSHTLQLDLNGRNRITVVQAFQ